MGDWKLVKTHLKDTKNKPTLELYNLRTDIKETTNVADQHPDILEKAAKILESQHTEPSIEKFRIPALIEGL
jgi:arylsulfatase